MSFRINDEKLLEKYKAIWINIVDLKNTWFENLRVVSCDFKKINLRVAK